MAASSHPNIERLRPEGMRSRPVRMPQVFDDTEAVLDLVQACSPYKTPFAFYNEAIADERADSPWFINMPKSDMLAQNPRWIAAAKEAFSAELVEPLHCTINVYGPSDASPPHMDLPVFRGMCAPKFPIWLLMTMSHSGLFLPWLVPVASGLAWFYRGEDGEFEYWPDGPHRPSACVKAPLWNVGMMSDNEVMYHRVGSIGSRKDIAKVAQLKASAVMQHCGEHWEIRQAGETLCAIQPDQLRISLLWKAYVFSSDEHYASFRDPAYDLDIEQVTETFLADLADGGISCSPPSDPLNDPEWQSLLVKNYRPALS